MSELRKGTGLFKNRPD